MNVETAETGSLGIMHLKRFWSKAIENRNTGTQNNPGEFELDLALLNALRLGLEPTMKYLYTEAPSFEAFEAWIMQNQQEFLSAEQITQFNEAVSTIDQPKPYTAPAEYLLTPQELEFWDQNGYLIIPEAISKADCRITIDVILDFLDIDENDPSTWYNPHEAKQGIMVQLFNHAVLEKNRMSPKIRSVYEQLWQRNDLLVNADRVGFNPPEREGHPFQGPDLHWDVSLQTPIPLGLQGLLYLSDTAENQGAFTLVPGFHKRVESWLSGLEEGVNPREADLHALGSKPLAAKAGDFIVWHQALPHGSSPNTAQVPRIVQYINYNPLNKKAHPNWI